MKHPKTKEKKINRERIMQSLLASFRIEGINIPQEQALAAFKKVVVNLER